MYNAKGSEFAVGENQDRIVYLCMRFTMRSSRIGFFFMRLIAAIITIANIYGWHEQIVCKGCYEIVILFVKRLGILLRILFSLFAASRIFWDPLMGYLLRNVKQNCVYSNLSLFSYIGAIFDERIKLSLLSLEIRRASVCSDFAHQFSI